MDTTKRSATTILAPFLKPYQSRLVSSVILEVISVLAGLVPYYAAANIINILLFDKLVLSQLLINVALGLVGHATKIFLHNSSTILSHESAFAILTDIRKRLADKLATVPMGYVLSKPSGSFKEIVMDIVEKLEKPFAHLIPEMTGSLMAPLATFIYLLIIDYRMALVALITIPLGLLFFSLMMRGYQESYTKYLNAGKAMNAAIAEYVGGIAVIKAFNQSASSYQKYNQVMHQHRDSMLDWFKRVMLYGNIGRSVFTSTLLFVLPIGAYFYATGSLSGADFLMSVMLSLGIVPPIMKALEFTDTIAEIDVYLTEIDHILSEPDLARPTEDVAVDDYTISFDKVGFAYEETAVLTDVSFVASANAITALVGPSGSGKSTIASLLASFWEVDDGSISIGGQDIRTMPLSQLMQLVTYVTQDNFLFDQTIAENIRAGRPSASDEEVIHAAKQASIHDFICGLPQQYNSPIGSMGARLSGGEKQRIAIARAILKDAPIIILDEATAYTDPDNEAVLQRSINAMVSGKTVIVIAHRLSTIIHAKNIIVIDKGRIVCQGRHDELLKNCPLYQTMWQAHIAAKDI